MIIIIYHEKSQLNTLVWGSLMLTQLRFKLRVLYSGKFSLVQIFVEKHPDSSEEIFAVFIFADARRSGHTPTS